MGGSDFYNEIGLLPEQDPIEYRLKGKGEITTHWHDETFFIVSTASMTVEDVMERAEKEGFKPDKDDVEAHIVRWAYGAKTRTDYEKFGMFTPSGDNTLSFQFFSI